jgi:hypothetical protein
MTDKTKSTRLTIGSPEFPVRFSYLTAFEPKEVENDDGVKSLKYSCQVIIDKKDVATKAAIDKAVEAAIAAEFPKRPANIKLPLRDGDLESDEKGDAVIGCWFFNVSSKQKPNVVGTTKDEFTGKLAALGPSEIKSGDYGRVSVNFFGFTDKSKGVGGGLGNIQKLKDGEPLGSQRAAEDDFGDLDEGFKD